MVDIAVRRGDIILVDFGIAAPFEVAHKRPAIVVSNNQANAMMHTCLVIPLTSNLQHIYEHEILLLAEESGLDKDSKTQPHLLRHVNFQRVQKFLSHLPPEIMQTIDTSLVDFLALEVAWG